MTRPGNLATVVLSFVLCIFQQGLAHAEPALGSAPPSLDSVTWGGQGTSFDSLKGKTVVVMTYVTWCPKCNAWSGDVFRGLSKAITDKPVVVLAISTDTPPAKSQAYMSERQFIGPKILHGFDRTIAKRMGFTNEFFNYAIISPESKIVAAGNAGSYRDINGGKVYSPAFDLGQQSDLGKFRFVTDEMSNSLRELVFPMELGSLPSATDTTRLKRGLSADDRQAFETMLDSFLDQQLEEATRLAEGDAAEKLTAFETATYLSGNFKVTEQGKKARKLLTELNKDKDLKKELAAKRLYDDAKKLPDNDSARQLDLYRNLAKKFPGTHYAGIATNAVEESLKPANRASDD